MVHLNSPLLLRGAHYDGYNVCLVVVGMLTEIIAIIRQTLCAYYYYVFDREYIWIC